DDNNFQHGQLRTSWVLGIVLTCLSFRLENCLLQLSHVICSELWDRDLVYAGESFRLAPPCAALVLLCSFEVVPHCADAQVMIVLNFLHRRVVLLTSSERSWIYSQATSKRLRHSGGRGRRGACSIKIFLR